MRSQRGGVRRAARQLARAARTPARGSLTISTRSRTPYAAVVFNEDGATAVRQTLRVEVEDTVGAGDAFIGGMAAALTAQVPLEEAIRRGVAAGTLACAGKGAQNAAPSAEQIAAAAKQLVARVVPPDTPIE